jgi:cell division protein FtsQ
MARKQAAQLRLEIEDEDPMGQAPEPEPERAASSGRRSRVKSAAAAAGSGWRGRTRHILMGAGIAAGVLVVVAGAYQLDEFLASDPHFLLPADAEQALAIEGLRFTARTEVQHVFARDLGRSVYLIPLAERRSRLLAIDWVRDATISRHWPNRISVQITERTPIAFAMLPNAEGWALSEVALVDADGVLLKPPARAKFSLPALAGISRRDSAAMRRTRVRQAAELIREVQAHAGQISEIDVSDPENLSVTEVAQGRPLRLRLGNRNYLARLSNFLSHYPDISRRLPNARTFDLRLDDHITAQDGGPDGR